MKVQVINPPSRTFTPEDNIVMSGALASASPPMSMKDLLGIKDPVKDGEDATQKQREKTAYVVVLYDYSAH